MTDARSLTLFLRGRTHNNMLDRMSLMIAPYQLKITWPEILESCSTLQREILCKSMGLIDEMSRDGKLRLSMVDPSLQGGPETRLKKKMRLLKQNQEEMDGKMYAK